jgi:NMD protein affecting ribosome stability and mRNA decay
MRFCPGCGKRISDDKTFCENCQPKKEIKVKDITVKFCCNCRKVFRKNKWTQINNMEDAVIAAAKDKIKEKARLSLEFPKIQFKPGLNYDIDINAEIKNDMFVIPARIEMTYCDICSKKQGEYFEGELQLRNITPEIDSFIKEYIGDTELFISDRKKNRNGIDLKLSDQKKLQNLAHQLQKRFGGQLKISPRIYSKDRQSSKEIYRVNAFYKAPDYHAGEAVKIDNKIILVSDVKKNISGTDLKTGKKVSVNPDNKEYEILKPEKTTVSRIYPGIEVLHPETFQSIPIKNKKKLSLGEKVKVVDDNGSIYVL